MTKAAIKKRRSEIIAALCKLSHGGWANARACDWKPLEDELHALDAKSSAA